MTRRVGQSAPYVVVVGGVLQSAHKTITTASNKAREAGGRVGVVTNTSLTIGQRVTIDKQGRCVPCA